MLFDVPNFNLLIGLGIYAAVCLILAVAALGFSLLASLSAYGWGGPRRVFSGIGGACRDLAATDFSRVSAISSLVLKESLRKKALYIFGVFAILFMFAGWFIGGTSTRPDLQVKVYVAFVLTAITWLTIPVVVLLACWGLPTDIKNRSVHTVITKPVRRHEIFLGRVGGYVCVGTFFLAVMGGVGYFWISRNIPAAAQPQLIGRVPIYGNMTFSDRFGNYDENIQKGGVNVGDIWDFRSFIEGGTKARSYYRFGRDKRLDVAALKVQAKERQAAYERDMTAFENGQLDREPAEPSAFDLEYNFEAFRTTKGDIDNGTRLMCQLTLINPDDRDVRVPLPAFQVMEFSERVEDKMVPVPVTISYRDEETSAERTADLFTEIMPKGEVIIEVQCLDPSQYLGMARPDLFIREPDRTFLSTFSKSIFGIWLRLVLMVLIAVTVTCFVKGPVATLATFGMYLVGFSLQAVLKDQSIGVIQYLSGYSRAIGTYGGGPVESAIRMAQHMNTQTPLSDTMQAFVMIVDVPLTLLLAAVSQIIPDFSSFRMTEYTASGFDVPWATSLFPGIMLTVAYVVPCLLISYFSLQAREMEAK